MTTLSLQFNSEREIGVVLTVLQAEALCKLIYEQDKNSSLPNSAFLAFKKIADQYLMSTSRKDISVKYDKNFVKELQKIE